MPIYTFKCQDCGQTVDVVSKLFVSKPPTSCLVCGGVSFIKVYNDFFVIFRGKGFYTNDSKRKKGQD